MYIHPPRVFFGKVDYVLAMFSTNIFSSNVSILGEGRLRAAGATQISSGGAGGVSFRAKLTYLFT